VTTYSVYEPTRGAAQPALRAEKVAFVKDGFSWPAFLVPLVWLIYQRMWIELVILVVLLGLVQWAIGTEEHAKALLTWASLAVSVLFGFVANDLRGFALERRGYRFAGSTSGRNREDAELAFFRAWLPEQGKAVRVPKSQAPEQRGPERTVARAAPSGEAEEVIGLFPKA
jgi:hypothetical protein